MRTHRPLGETLGKLLNGNHPEWDCSRCNEPQRSFGKPPENLICHDCMKQQDAADERWRRRNRPAATKGDWQKDAGIPERFIQKRFVAPKPWPLGLDRWLGSPWSVALIGSVGVGKSFLAAELAVRVGLDREVRGLWIRAAEVPYLAYSQGRAYELATFPVLVLDDLGRGHVGGGWEAVTEVVSMRYDRLLPTIITSNMSFGDLAAEHGGRVEALADRFREGISVNLVGDSRRRKV